MVPHDRNAGKGIKPMLLVQPFIEFAFMRKALVACVAIAISATPLGVFLSLRRMSLVGDALSHAVLPRGLLWAICFPDYHWSRWG